MSIVALVEVGVIAVLGAALVVKVWAQRRQGVSRPIVLGNAGHDLVSRVEPAAVPLLFLWFASIALHGSGWAPRLFEPRLFRAPALEAVGALLALGAMGLLLTSLFQMGRSWRIGIDPDSHEGLVTSGVFGLSRNPIYVALDLIAVSAFLISGSLFFLVSGLVVMTAIHVQIWREERFLSGAFGEEYQRYRSRVPRYLGRRSRSPGEREATPRSPTTPRSRTS
jgi:protein-S-isoprenylcysteine O-methyltransferase Ste14